MSATTTEHATILLADNLTPHPSPLAVAWRTVAIAAARHLDRAGGHDDLDAELQLALADAIAAMVRA